MDGSIERFLAQLEAEFDAACTKDEEIAAADLARSLDRGLCFRERLCRTGGGLTLLLSDGARLGVSLVAVDYYACGDPEFLIGRLEGSAFALTEAEPPPAMGRSTFAQALRHWSESSPAVVVTGSMGSFTGRLVIAGSDHVVLATSGGRVVLGLAALETVRLARGG